MLSFHSEFYVMDTSVNTESERFWHESHEDIETSPAWTRFDNTSVRPSDADVLGVVLLTSWHVILGAVMACLSVVTVVGNSMVLHAVRTERSLQTVRNKHVTSREIFFDVSIKMTTSGLHVVVTNRKANSGNYTRNMKTCRD